MRAAGQHHQGSQAACDARAHVCARAANLCFQQSTPFQGRVAGGAAEPVTAITRSLCQFRTLILEIQPPDNGSAQVKGLIKGSVTSPTGVGVVGLCV